MSPLKQIFQLRLLCGNGVPGNSPVESRDNHLLLLRRAFDNVALGKAKTAEALLGPVGIKVLAQAAAAQSAEQRAWISLARHGVFLLFFAKIRLFGLFKRGSVQGAAGGQVENALSGL